MRQLKDELKDYGTYIFGMKKDLIQRLFRLIYLSKLVHDFLRFSVLFDLKSASFKIPDTQDVL